MADIRHRVGIAAPKEQVYEALSTVEGLSGWWTRDTAGDPAIGGKLEFFFGQPEPAGVMEVAGLLPGQQVAWRFLGQVPLLDLHLRLGEGTGAVLAMHLVEAALRVYNDMATFDEAGVSDRDS